MKRYLYILMMAILIVTMSELQTAGMLPSIATDLNEPISRVGLLVSIYALGMAIGAPIITFFLRRQSPRLALSCVIAGYAVIELVAPVVHQYWWLALARLVTGCLSGATFGLSIIFATRLAPSPSQIGRAVSIVLSGLTVGTVIGLPMSHYIANQWDWQACFYLLGIAALIISFIVAKGLPDIEKASESESAEDLHNLTSPKLWSCYLVSFLTIGAAYGSFSFFTPLLQENAGFSSDATTTILFGYGICTVIGNLIVGRFADAHPVGILITGHSILLVALITLSLFSHVKTITLIMVLIVGLIGISMNPALVTRVTKAGGTGFLVTTVHTTLVTLGVTSGTTFSSFSMGIFGENPVVATWTGVFLVVLVLCVLTLQVANFKKR
ncbi:Major facilitator superfamily transporter [Xenorhabdus poinarii G6]|uniref:Major facilitator superfamily transporter n=1 Tax=Xenorhabdus poinarii G6 TaxID=1354304 RepID=A0A068QYQ1_9GAMM|nr:MFS transporter [Xenorhabdus poinarii]CDG19751.1 Major facilitator superfamily transporter [Xenorhabdus poinarii G6]